MSQFGMHPTQFLLVQIAKSASELSKVSLQTAVKTTEEPAPESDDLTYYDLVVEQFNAIHASLDLLRQELLALGVEKAPLLNDRLFSQYKNIVGEEYMAAVKKGSVRLVTDRPDSAHSGAVNPKF